MSADLYQVGVAFDSSKVVAGTDQMTAGFVKAGAASDAMAAQTARLQRLLDQSYGAYAGVTGAADMAADAQYRAALATGEEQAGFDRIIGSARAAALEHQRLAEGVIDVAGAEEAATAATTEATSAFTLSGAGASYMARSLDMLALSSIGVGGGMGRAAAATAVFGLGAGPAIAVIAGIAAIVGIIESLIGKTDQATDSAQKLVAALNEEAEKASAQSDPLDAYNKKIAQISASTLELQKQLDALRNQPGQTQGALLPGSVGAGTVDLGPQLAQMKSLEDQISKNNAAEVQAGVDYRTAAAALADKNDVDKQNLELLQAAASVQALNAGQMAQLNGVIADYNQRLQAGNLTTADRTALLRELGQAHELESTQVRTVTTDYDAQTKSAAALAEAQLTAAADTARSIGDYLGAAQLAYQADLQRIGAANDLLVAQGKLTQAQADQAIDAETNTAWFQRQAQATEQLRQATESFLATLKGGEQSEAQTLKDQATQLGTLYKAQADAMVADAQISGDLDAVQRAQRAAAIVDIDLQVSKMMQLTDAEKDQYKQALLMLEWAKEYKQAQEDIANAVKAWGQAQGMKDLGGYAGTGVDFANIADATVTPTVQQAQDAFARLGQTLRGDISNAFTDAFTGAKIDAASIGNDIGSVLGDAVGATLSKAIQKAIDDAAKNSATLVGAIGGALAGGLAGYNSGSPLEGIAAGVGTGLALGGGPVGAIVGGLAGLASGILGESQKAKQAEAAYLSSLATFTEGLNQFVSGIGVASDSLQSEYAQSMAQIQDQVNKAYQVAGIALPAAGQTIAQDSLAVSNADAGTFDPKVRTLLYELDELSSAAKAAADVITNQFIASIHQAYTASLPGGNNLNTLAGYRATQTQNLIDNLTAFASGGEDAAGFQANQSLINSTFTNNWQTFLSSLSESDLQTILPQLTGDQYAYAASLIATDQATKDANDSQSLAIRQAQDNGNDLLVKQLQDQAEYQEDAAGGMSAANLATLKLIQTQEEEATAAQVAAQALQTMLGQVSDLASAAASAGDSSSDYALNLITTENTITNLRHELDSLYASGTITGAQFASLSHDLDVDLNGAINSTTGTIQTLTTATQILADNASQLTQQFNVFGTSLADQADTLRNLYGFAGLSDDQIRSEYVTVTPGQELTDAQKQLDDNIANYFATENQYLQSLQSGATVDTTVASGATGATSIGPATATYGPTLPIITGPNTFNITVDVGQNDLANPDAFVGKLQTALDSAFRRRATLEGAAMGLQP